MQKTNYDFIGTIIIVIFLVLLGIAGFISYKSIDWDVLKRIESQTLVLPTQSPASPSVGVSDKASTPSSNKN
jgi:hypothetical protein